MLLHCLLTIYLLQATAAQRGGAVQRPNPEANDILSQVSDINPDGSFYTKWETANGIAYEEQGQLKSLGGQETAEAVQGSASWTTNEGERVSITWQADENGAVFQGDHLPTAPPAPEIPPLIQRALEWTAAHPSKESNPSEGQYQDDNGAGAPVPPPRPAAPRRPAPRRF